MAVIPDDDYVGPERSPGDLLNLAKKAYLDLQWIEEEAHRQGYWIAFDPDDEPFAIYPMKGW
jgi:hypothetical protein